MQVRYIQYKSSSFKIVIIPLCFIISNTNLFAQSTEPGNYSVIKSIVKQIKDLKYLNVDFAKFKGYNYDFSNILNRNFLGRSNYFLDKIDSIDTFFSKGNFEAMKKQIEDYRNIVKLRKGFIEDEAIHIINSKDKRINSTNKLFMITPPLFSIDNNKAIMYVETFCGEDGCSNGIVYATQKINGK
jgi:hypothetical protein